MPTNINLISDIEENKLNKNYLEQQFFSKKLFLHEEYLEINYLPDELLHREEELIILSKIFIKLIENPFLISRKVLILGEIGIGKTAITKSFGKMLLISAKKRNIDIRYVHINCRREKTNFKIVYQILKELGYPVPSRGFSPADLMTFLQDYLKTNNIYLFLILDELNYLDNSKFNLIYSLTRWNESNFSKLCFISFISIVRDITSLRNLDEATISSLQGNILSLKKYSLGQMIDILDRRVEIAVKKGVFSKDLIHFIAEKLVNSGDVRKALNVIRNTVKIAEMKGHNKVELEDVQDAMKNLIPSLEDDIINCLTKHQNFILLALSIALIDQDEDKVPIDIIRDVYEDICKKHRVIPRKTTQIWQNLQILKNYDLITIDNISKNMKGRKSFFSLNRIPLNLLKMKLERKLASFYQTGE